MGAGRARFNFKFQSFFFIFSSPGGTSVSGRFNNIESIRFVLVVLLAFLRILPSLSTALVYDTLIPLVPRGSCLIFKWNPDNGFNLHFPFRVGFHLVIRDFSPSFMLEIYDRRLGIILNPSLSK